MGDRRPTWCLLLAPSALPFCGRLHAGYWKHREEAEPSSAYRRQMGRGIRSPEDTLQGKMRWRDLPCSDTLMPPSCFRLSSVPGTPLNGQPPPLITCWECCWVAEVGRRLQGEIPSRMSPERAGKVESRRGREKVCSCRECDRLKSAMHCEEHVRLPGVL